MRLLLVEDEEKLAKALTRALSSSGYAVDHLINGAEALNRLSLYRKEYDVVILDLMIPELPGEEVCRQAREKGVTTPIIVLTAKDAVDNKVDLLHLGADDYMVKPFAFRELLARIHAVMRRPDESLPTTLVVGDLELDSRNHTAHFKGEPLTLTLKEFVLLEYFMRNPNKALNREEILDHLWDFAFSGLSNIVDVHVKNLRKKLGKDGDRIIQTVRGVGYQLVE